MKVFSMGDRSTRFWPRPPPPSPSVSRRSARTEPTCRRLRASGARPKSYPTSPIAKSSSHSACSQTLAEDGPTIQPFDQEKWAARIPRNSGAEALAAFSALRKWNLRLIRDALPGAAGRMMTHPERGTMTFQSVVETMAGHDLNHLGQLRRIASRQEL
jgi:hypothetical protein